MKLTEFDNEKTAVLNPEHFYNRLSDCPKTVVTCFAVNLIEYAVNTYPSRVICNWSSSNGVIPFYEIKVNGEKIGIIMSMIGAPSAVAEYEELFAMGVENILVFGTCGVLDKSISDCSVIVPVSAVRDEGTSFHYLPDSDEIEVNVGLQHKITNYLKKKKIKHTVGKTWTTDAIYRETKAKVQKRKKEGCTCVDMECSAIAAVAAFRNKSIAQFFYSADNLDGDEYEKRSIANDANIDVKLKILDLAIGMALEIFE